MNQNLRHNVNFTTNGRKPVKKYAVKKSSSLGSHGASRNGTPDRNNIDIPPPIQEYIEQLYRVVENEMFQYLHGIIFSPADVTREVGESDITNYEIPSKTIIYHKITDIIKFVLNNSTASESHEATLDQTETFSQKDTLIVDENHPESKNTQFSDKVSVYKRVSYTATDKDKLYNQLIAFFCESLQNYLQHIHVKISIINTLYPEIEIDKQEKENLRSLLRPILYWAKISLQKHYQKLWQQMCEDKVNELVASSPLHSDFITFLDMDTTDMPPPIREYIEEICFIFENETLQFYHQIMTNPGSWVKAVKRYVALPNCFLQEDVNNIWVEKIIHSQTYVKYQSYGYLSFRIISNNYLKEQSVLALNC